MPALSPTMTEGVLAKWLVSEGDKIKSGDVIAEIETDKATMELETVDQGKVMELLFSNGEQNIPVNTPIAIICNATMNNQKITKTITKHIPKIPRITQNTMEMQVFEEMKSAS